MSVKFTSGPHPTAQARSASTSSLHSRQPSGAPPNQNDASNPAASSSIRPSRLMDEDTFSPVEDPERQPLIPTTELNRNRVFYPVAVGVAVVVTFGLIVGFGGWRLGQGTGGGRWPGGPH